jgi:uncharacterized surface protein with fasciclin (FAS1) repeats
MNKLNKQISALLLVITLVGLLGCADDFVEIESPSGTTLADVADANADLDIFVAVMNKTNLLNSLDNNNSGQYTVFAPHDSAFAAFFRTSLSKTVAYGEAQVLTYISDTLSTTSAVTLATVASRLNYHIVSSKISSSAITVGNAFTTLNGARLSLSKSGTNVYLNATAAKVAAADADGANGTIHTINRVLSIPSTASIVAALGMGVSYNTNPATITGGSETGGDDTGTDYDILAYALRRTRLAEVLLPNSSPLPDYTVFAPTDDAFRSYLGDNTAASAVQENAAIQLVKALDLTTLSNLLKYHVVPGRNLSTDLTNAQVVATALTGKSITINKSATITITDGNGTSADATVSQANNLTNAGVFHRVNAVLQPE